MKTGIMSMHRVVNYGSVMQAYALREMVTFLGHEVEFVDYKVEPTIHEHTDRKCKSYPIKKLYRILCGEPVFNKSLITSNENDVLFAPMWEQLGFSKGEYNYRAKVDTLIVGSDEVFNCLQNNPNVGFSMELFGRNNRANKLISYAASFGDTTIERLKKYDVDKVLAKYLREFDTISVRDKNSAAIIHEICGVEPIQHLDPVLVGNLEKMRWSPIHKTNYVAVYGYWNRFSDEEGRAIVQFAKEQELELVSINGKQKFCDNIPYCSPSEIIPYFQNASFVVTDTFHGLIFSIITHTPFAVFCRKPANNTYANSFKINDLLEKLGLMDRLVTEPGQLSEIMNKSIDFGKIEKIREEERKRSIAYLKENI